MQFDETAIGEFGLRTLRDDDAARLAAAYTANRDHLAPWDPERDESFYAEQGQQSVVDDQLAQVAAGTAAAFVITDGDRIIGRVNLVKIVRGISQSAVLGYWVDAHYTGRGITSRAVGAVIEYARNSLQLHRIEAGTLPSNLASQSLLVGQGFTRIGIAQQYLQIAGKWQDHVLFQLLL